ncbi:MAG: uracil-DNA glycosylase [Actinomycetota bacterium]
MPISSKESQDNLNVTVKKCKKCPDLAKSRKQSVPGVGAPNAKIIIIGYYPRISGAEKTGVPFKGDGSGDFLSRIIKEVGLSLKKDTYLTYLVKCSPRKKGKNVSPKKEHIENCISYFIKEISISTPHIIVSLGLRTSNLILKHFFSLDKEYEDISKIHMRVFENPSFKLVPFYSPHDVMVKKAITEDKYIQDFKSLAKLLKMV